MFFMNESILGESFVSPKTLVRLEARAKVLKAMAHPSRLIILEALAKHECCVAELTELIGSDMSTVSKHLSVLQNIGLVGNERRGTQIFYRLLVPCILESMNCIEAVIKAHAEAKQACCLK
jgi:ArsR family transcriptional regulator